MDECSSNPCQNNATCVDDVNGYICECHQGFRGKKVCFVGVATIVVEPRPYKCVGSGKKLVIPTYMFVTVTRDSEVRILGFCMGVAAKLVQPRPYKCVGSGKFDR